MFEKPILVLLDVKGGNNMIYLPIDEITTACRRGGAAKDNDNPQAFQDSPGRCGQECPGRRGARTRGEGAMMRRNLLI